MFNETEFRAKIPYQPGTEEYKFYEAMIPTLKQRTQQDKPRILGITDIEQYCDDLTAIILLSEMHRLGVVELAGFITNLEPASQRAMFLRTALHLLGIPDVPVAVGTQGVGKKEQLELSYYELKNSTFATQTWNEEPFLEGAQLIDKLAKQVDDGKEPLTVLLISSLQDISEYFDFHSNNLDFLKSHFKKFVSQGGYTIDDSNGSLQPIMDMANNSFHPAAASNYTKYITMLEMPSDAWSKHAAVASAIDGNHYHALRNYGPLGHHIMWLRDRQEFKFYWNPLNAPVMPHLNTEWYLKARLALDPASSEFQKMKANPPAFNEIPAIIKIPLHDACAAVGTLGDDILRGLGIMGELPSYNTAAHKHRRFGVESNDLGGIDTSKLQQAIVVFFFGAMRATYQNAEKLIPTETIKYNVEHYDVNLDVFNQQLPFWNELQSYEAQAKVMKETTITQEYTRKVAELRADVLVDTSDNPILNAKGAPYPKVPKFIPYELLYKKATQATNTKQNVNSPFWTNETKERDNQSEEIMGRRPTRNQ